MKGNMDTSTHGEMTVFNTMQLHLLKMFSFAKTNEQMKEIKAALSDYFFHKVEEGMSELWANGDWDEKKNEEIMNEHLRTPYIYK